MGLVKSGSRATATAAASALVVADDRCCASAIAALERAVDLRSACVSIVTVPERRLVVSAFAPMSGLVMPGEVQEECVARAAEAARRAAIDLGAARVDHRVVASWLQVMRLVTTGRHDVLVVGRRPRRRALRALVRCAAEADTALVLADQRRG